MDDFEIEKNLTGNMELTAMDKEKEMERTKIEYEKAFGKKPKVSRSPKPNLEDYLKEQIVDKVDNVIDQSMETAGISGLEKRDEDEKSQEESRPESVSSQTNTEDTDEWLYNTPPRNRTTSLPNLEKSNKRKRVTGRTEGDSPCLLSNGLQVLFKEVANLESLLSKSYKPKTAIKDTASRVANIVGILEKTNILTLLEDPLYSAARVRELQEENQVLKMELRTLKESQTGARQDGTECPNCLEVRKLKRRREIIKTEESFECFQKVTEDDWNGKVFPTILSEGRPLWEASYEEDMILPCNKSLGASNKMVLSAISRFGGREGLLSQNKNTGEVAIMTHTLGFPDIQGNIENVSRNIYYPIIEDGKVWEEINERTMFNSLKQLKEIITRRGNRNIAIPTLEGVTGIMFERMILFLLCDTNVAIRRYGVKRDETASKANDVSKPSFNGRTSNGGGKRKKDDGLLVQAGNQSYADLLKIVKQTINPDEIGVDIKDISKTRKGQLLVRVGNGVQKTKELREKIKEKLPEVSTSLLRNDKVLHIKGMDETITEGEIVGAIATVISVEKDSFKVSSVRPSFGGKRNATIIMNENDAEKLIKTGAIRIGWTSCKIKERKPDTRCYKCWGYGHTKAKCSGPDRQTMCLKCAKQGHKAIECPNNPYCIHCKTDEHQTGSSRCPLDKGSKKRTLTENVT